MEHIQRVETLAELDALITPVLDRWADTALIEIHRVSTNMQGRLPDTDRALYSRGMVRVMDWVYCAELGGYQSVAVSSTPQ